jgi:tRNA modification GTPase
MTTVPTTLDHIAALATPAGPGARAVVRLSGPGAVAAVASLCDTAGLLPPRRLLAPVRLRLPGVVAPLPAEVYVWPAPHSITGQEVAEVHTVSSPPLVEALLTALLGAGARAARPGEFTMRGFLAGKLDLTRAEAVLAVVEAGDLDELKQALTQLAGGVARPVQALRDDLLNLLADVEAGLDFADEDIAFVGEDELRRRIGSALAQVTGLGRQLDRRSVSERVFRAALAGRPNAGKSSLFNALGGRALVADEPGTTRDYLTQRLRLDGCHVELIDTPGRTAARDGIEAQGQELGRAATEAADLLLVCVPADEVVGPEERALLGSPGAVPVATKCDLAAAPPGWLATSAATGAGLEGLRALLAERARSRREPPLAPSLSRCRHHVAACLEHLRRAHALVIEQEPPELLALELRGALDRLGEMAGAVYTDDLLDRVFSRFCIGK